MERRIKQLESQLRIVMAELQKISDKSTRPMVGPVMLDKNNEAQQYQIRVVNGSVVAEEIE